MSRGRIAITGVGIVSALGQTAAETFGALMRGERGIGSLSLFDVGDVRSTQVGEVKGLVPGAVLPRGDREGSRTDAMAVQAAREAVAQARLPAGARLGIALGGTTGGMFETEQVLSSPALESLSPARAARLISYPLSASLGHVERAVGKAVLTRSVCSACSSGAIALVQAVAWLARGDVDFVLAGGADGLCRLTLLGFNALGATDAAPCRPFDIQRGGMNLGEGAGVLVLEREERALSRGAEVLAFLDGYAVGAEAHHVTHPDPEGACAKRLLRAALSRAGRAPSELSYVNAHGTGTQQNDAMEGRALLEVLGEHAGEVWVSSSKAQLGHTLGASGAIEAAISVLSLLHGQVPPSVGLSVPELPGLRHVRSPNQSARVQAVLSSSFGFGGMSCVLLFAHGNSPPPPTPPPPRGLCVRSVSLLSHAERLEQRLDGERSRRFDRASMFAAVAASEALGSSSPDGVGLVLGTAFGNVERTMAFLARGREKGPRHVPPAEFPHLVPSAPAGNASVYARLTGPVFSVSDLAQSGEAAFDAGADLLELGIAQDILVGATAPKDAIVEHVLSPLFEPNAFAAPGRGEGAALLWLSARDAETGAGTARLLMRVRAGGWRGVHAKLPEPPAGGRFRVVMAVATNEVRAALLASPWGAVTPLCLAQEGYHEALGAVALATAARFLADAHSEIEQVLVLSGGLQGVTATLLARGGPAEA